MLIKIGIGLVLIVAVFLGIVATRDGKFHYERSGIIAAEPEVIFPYISDFKKGDQWSPYVQMDPNMKTTFSGPDAQIGSVMEFEGNSQAGSGRLEIINLIPNELVEIKLTMLKPMKAENLVQYRLTKEEAGTRFSWSMTGDGGFLGKLMNVFIDCEKMVADQFTKGINNLKALIEGQSGN